jgi:3',5'-cyclic AMP phosphodiesterase CpdA
MRLAHVSDFHNTYLTWNPLRLMSKRFFGHFNWIFNRDKEFSLGQIEPLVGLFSELKVDLVLLGGDFTTTSMPEEFEQAAAYVAKLSQPWIAIPGNHDQYTYRSHRKQLYYRYLSNRPADHFSLAVDRIEGHRIAPHWWVIALDTALPTQPASSRGLFSPTLEAKLEELLARIPESDQILLFNHYPFFQNEEAKKTLERGDALEALIRRHPRISLYLHGHTHRHMIADLQADGLPIVLDSGSCAQGPKGAWNLIDIDDQGCTISAYRWNQGWYKSRTEQCVWKR